MSSEKSIIEYPSENCWPDILDLQSIMRRLTPEVSLRFPAKAKAKEARIQSLSPVIYQDFRVLYEWLEIMCNFCHNHGRHYYVDAQGVLNLAEGFIGHKLSEDAFLAAIAVRGIKTREFRGHLEEGETKFKFLSIKVPDFGRIQEATPLWERHVSRYRKTAAKVEG